MAVRVEIPREYVTRAFEAAISSLKRSEGKYGINPLVQEMIRKDIALYNNAMINMSEVK